MRDSMHAQRRRGSWAARAAGLLLRADAGLEAAEHVVEGPARAGEISSGNPVSGRRPPALSKEIACAWRDEALTALKTPRVEKMTARMRKIVNGTVSSVTLYRNTSRSRSGNCAAVLRLCVICTRNGVLSMTTQPLRPTKTPRRRGPRTRSRARRRARASPATCSLPRDPAHGRRCGPGRRG